MLVDGQYGDHPNNVANAGAPVAVCKLNAKTTPILDDYMISSTVLGLGINGKVVECFRKKDNCKFALKVSIC